jgi:type I restriction enzyme, R subunit
MVVTRSIALSNEATTLTAPARSSRSAVRELGSDVLDLIARDLVRSIRQDVTVDWALREQARARLRSNVKRLLSKYDYPPDAEQEAIVLVLKQTETFAEQWAA